MVAAPCPTCHGVGYVRTVTHTSPLGHDEVTHTFSSEGECLTCRATGRLWGQRGQDAAWQDLDILSGRWRHDSRDVLGSVQ
jgi:hypothetical protein